MIYGNAWSYLQVLFAHCFSLLAGLTYQHNLQIGVVWLFFSGQQLFSDDLCIIFYRFFSKLPFGHKNRRGIV